MKMIESVTFAAMYTDRAPLHIEEMSMAETEGFEPSDPVRGLHLSRVKSAFRAPFVRWPSCRGITRLVGFIWVFVDFLPHTPHTLRTPHSSNIGVIGMLGDPWGTPTRNLCESL